MPWRKKIPKDAPPKQKDITQYKSLGHFLEPFISQLSGMSQEEMQRILYEGTHSEEAYVSDQYAKWVMDNATAQDREGLMRFIVNLYLAAAGMKVSALETNKIVEVSQFPPSPYRAGEKARIVSVDSDWTYTIRFMKDGTTSDKVSGNWLTELPLSEQLGCNEEERDSAEHVRMDEHAVIDWGKIKSPRRKHGNAASALDRTMGLFFEKGNRWSGILENLKESFPDLTDDDINGIKEEIRRRVEQYKIQLESSRRTGQSQTGIPPDPSPGWDTTRTDFDSFRGRGYNKLRSRDKERTWPGGKPQRREDAERRG
jgi:hypothetical protein